MIKLDTTRYSLVILCTLCPWRHAIAGTDQRNHDRHAGYTIGAAHERSAHDGLGGAAVAAYKAAQRAQRTI